MNFVPVTSRLRQRPQVGVGVEHPSYKWWALSCTSLGLLLATINSGTLIIALPDLERSLNTTILQLVWVILVYMITSTVLVLSAGRLADLFGRKRAFQGPQGDTPIVAGIKLGRWRSGC
jgi:MFS family permease